MKKRLEYIDMVKGIGILGIIVMHSSVMPTQRAVSWVSSFATPLFFLTSGLLIGCTGEEEKSGREVLLRKSRSLLLPFLYFSLICILRDTFRMAAGTCDAEELKLQGIALVTFWGSSVLWFLPALFLSEILFVFLKKKLKTAGTCAAVLLLTAVSFFLDDMLMKQAVFLPPGKGSYALLCVVRTVFRSVYALPYVCTGYVLFRVGKSVWEEEGGRSVRQFFGGIVLFVSGIPLSVLNGYFDLRSLDMGDTPVLAYLSAALSFLGVLFICKNCRPIKPLSYFGKNSLIVMATHIDFYLLYIALNAAYRVNNYIPGWNRVFFFVNVVGIILILEIPCIEAVNRFFPFLLGKRRVPPERKYSHDRGSLI